MNALLNDLVSKEVGINDGPTGLYSLLRFHIHPCLWPLDFP